MSIVFEGIQFNDTIDGLGTHQRAPVRAATVASGTLISDFTNGDAIDGVTLITGDYILIKDQVSLIENGFYVVQAAGVPLRRSDLESGEDGNSVTSYIKEGTVNSSKIFTCTSPVGTDVVDTNDLIFSESSLTGTLGVDRGGTGATSFTSGNVLIGNGTGAIIATKAAPAGDFVGTTDVQTMTNKTLDSPTIQNNVVFDEATNDFTLVVTDQATGTATGTIPDLAGVSQDFVFTSQTQTLSNKTIASPIITGDTIHDLATNDLTIAITDQATGTATVTVPDLAGVSQDYVFTAAVQTITNKTLVDPAITDDALTITAATGTSRQLVLDVNGADSTSTTLVTNQTVNRTLNLPDKDGTLATLADTQDAAAGISWKENVRLGTTGNLDVNASISGTITYSATGGASGRGQITATLDTSDTFIVDGITLAAANDGTRLLLKDQTTGDQNGIWTTTITGTSLTLDRAADFDTDEEVKANSNVWIAEGTTQADNAFVLITNNPITIGGGSGTNLVWTQFNGAGQIIAGDGLDKNVNTLSVDLKANGGLVIESTEIALNLGASSITGTLAVADGGTGTTSLTSGNVLIGDGTSAVTTSKVAPTGAFVGTTDTQTLSNKTLTSPIINEILDANSNEILVFNTTASAVNHFTFTNAATGSGPTITSVGTDTNVDFNLQSQGTGVYNFNATADVPAELRIFEDTDLGSNYVGIDVPNVTTSYTLTMPPAIGTTNQILRLADGSGNLEFATVTSAASTFNWFLPFQIVVDKTVYTTVAYMAWNDTVYTAFSAGRMIWEVANTTNRDVDIRIRDLTAGANVVEVTGVTADAFRNDGTFTNPSANARLALQVRKSANGGTNPSIFGWHTTWDE